MNMTIGITFDLRADYLAAGYSEEEVAEFDSGETIAAIEETLRALGYAAERIGSARRLAERLVLGERWDLVFNIAEGLSGRCRESQVPALLELYDIGYTFSDPLVCAVTLDKGIAKRLAASHGVPTPPYRVVRHPSDLDEVNLAYPLFAKPIAEGTGKGIDGRSRIDTPRELSDVCLELLHRFRQPVLVEEFLPGREFTVALLGNGSDRRALGTMEIEILGQAEGSVYSYTAKEECESHVRYSALRHGPLRRKIEKAALKAYCALECRDAARADIRLDRYGEPAFMEINPLPGLHPTHSDLPMIAAQEGMAYSELLASIVHAAQSRLGMIACPTHAAS